MLVVVLDKLVLIGRATSRRHSASGPWPPCLRSSCLRVELELLVWELVLVLVLVLRLVLVLAQSQLLSQQSWEAAQAGRWVQKARRSSAQHGGRSRYWVS